jgi:branched-chain amino acid transport system substrate-binding protein
MDVQMPAPRGWRARALATLLALVAAGGVAACGSDDTSSGGSAATVATAPATATQPAPAASATAPADAVTDYVQYTGGTRGAADPSKSTIRIGWLNQQGGPADPSPFATDAAKLAVSYINKQLGGVDGHPVALVSCFTSTTDEQGQVCGQKLANDKRVDVIAVGAMTIGAQSVMAAVDNAKPMVYSVATGPSDATNRNGYILFGDLVRVMPPMATFAKQVLKAKSAAVIFPEAPGVSIAATALDEALAKAGVGHKKVGFAPNATDLVGPLTAAGAQTADVVSPIVLPQQCVNVAKALQQTKIKAQVVANPLCLNGNVAKALGDLPRWYYGIASSLAADRTDPAAGAFMGIVQKYGDVQKVGDPYYPITFAQFMTIAKWMNAIGSAKLSPESIAAQAKGFKGPLAMGPPTLQCGKYPDAPAICNDQEKIFKYEGKGVFTPASGWLGPPQ